MKKTILSLSFVLSAAAMGCGGEEAVPPPKAPEPTAAKVDMPPPPPPKEEPKPEPAKPTLAELQAKALGAMVEAMNAHDAKKVAALYAETATWKFPGAPDTTGREKIEQAVGMMFQTFPDMKIANAVVLTKGDVTVTQFALTATHKGDMGPIKATNKPVGWQAIAIQFWTPEGQIKDEHAYWDNGTMMSQIGLSKMKAPAIPTLAATTTAVTAKGDDAETKNVDLVKGMYGAMEKKSADAFTALMTDTSEWNDNTQPAPSKGKSDAKKFFDAHMKAFPDAKMNVKSSWGFGDFVVSEVTMTGTNTGPLFGKPATKKAVSMDSADLVQMKDGKIVKGWSFGNGMQVAEQLGLLPKPKDAAPAKAAPAKAAPAKAAPAKAAPKK